MAILEIEHLSKAFDQPAVIDVSLALERGRITSLLGPSGCGKTTLLRLVAGLDKPDRGRVIFEGKDITAVAPHQRQFGFMFQEFALFPHKSVFENIAFGLQMQDKDAGEVKRRTAAMLDLVGLARLSRRRVNELSGGEKQRVALARSLAPEPRLLMLDEPLGSLDRALRERLTLEIRDILKNLGITAIFVTHDQSEALTIADDIAVMNQGRIEQIDAPEHLYLNPGTIFVARFLGFQNLLAGRTCPDGGIATGLGKLYPRQPASTEDRAVTLMIRPEAAILTGSDSTDVKNPILTGNLVARLFTGRSYRITVALTQGVQLVFDLPNDSPPPPEGETIQFQLQPDKMVVIQASV
jgi:ABC-type Fe3+/spermidine/putrescine transport system ATPase subunit